MELTRRKIAYICNCSSHNFVLFELSKKYDYALEIFDDPEVALETIRNNPQDYLAIVSSFIRTPINGIDLMKKLKNEGYFGIPYRAIHSYIIDTRDFLIPFLSSGLTKEDVTLITKVGANESFFDYLQTISSISCLNH